MAHCATAAPTRISVAKTLEIDQVRGLPGLLDWMISQHIQRTTSEQQATGLRAFIKAHSMESVDIALCAELNSPFLICFGNAASGKDESRTFRRNGATDWRPALIQNCGTEDLSRASSMNQKKGYPPSKAQGYGKTWGSSNWTRDTSAPLQWLYVWGQEAQALCSFMS